MDAGVGTHLKGLLDGVRRVVVAHGQGNDLDVVAGLLDLERLLDRILIELTEEPIGGVAIHGVVIGEFAVTRGVGHVFHQRDDLHLTPP